MEHEVKYWNAIALAVLGGAVGLQELYVGHTWLFILAILFCWTGIPALVAWVEALCWLYDGEDYFYQVMKYDK